MLDLALLLCLGGIGLVIGLGVVVLVLVKLGVIVQYATKEEPPEEGDYGLEQSRGAGEE